MKTAFLFVLLAGLSGIEAAPSAAAVTREPRVSTQGDTILISLVGPRPERITRREIPDRLVFDFPGPPMDGFGIYPRTHSLDHENLLAFRRGQCEDDRGAHARLTLVLARPLDYRVSWGLESGTILMWPSEPRADSRLKAFVSGGAPARAAARKPAPRVAITTPATSKPAALHGAPAPAAAPTAATVQSLLRSGSVDSAAAALEAPSFSGEPRHRAELFSELALLESGRRADPRRIERHAREALAGGEESARLDMAMGRALDRQKRFEEAGRWHRRATQVISDPDRVNTDVRSAYFLWADDVYRTGRPADESLSAYAEAMQAYPSAPEVPWALYQSSKLHRRLGRAGEAVRLQNELLTRFPSDYWSTQMKVRLGAGLSSGAENQP